MGLLATLLDRHELDNRRVFLRVPPAAAAAVELVAGLREYLPFELWFSPVFLDLTSHRCGLSTGRFSLQGASMQYASVSFH